MFNIAIVTSRFNEEITTLLQQGAMARLKELGFKAEQITAVWVPGAVEIPVTVQRLALREKYEAIVALGAVIQGETNHYDYVCDQVSQGCQRVALDHGIPVIFGVLTTETVEQAQERVGGSHGHKGRDAIDTAVAMVQLFREI